MPLIGASSLPSWQALSFPGEASSREEEDVTDGAVLCL